MFILVSSSNDEVKMCISFRDCMYIIIIKDIMKYCYRGFICYWMFIWVSSNRSRNSSFMVI